MEKMSVVTLIFAHNNDQDVVKQRLNVKSSVDSSLKYYISQVMAENEVKFWPGRLLQSPSQNEYLVLFSPNGYTLFTIRGYSFLHTKFPSTNPVDTPGYSFREVIHFEGDTFREGSLYIINLNVFL